MSSSLSESYFVDGGTLRPDTPSYVKRPADDELFNSLIDREFCYILTPRQMGKSSLMIHTSQRLKEQNIKIAIVDIQGIGTNREKEWYTSLLSQIRRGLKLTVDIDEWMKQKSNVGFGQLFIDFIQDVVLTEIPEQVIIFLDEVDWMIKIDFRDDFFASIRSIYNARAQYPEFNRISFVLLGVASPADLISEPTRTPFNIGHAIPLQELSLKDATPLQEGLEQVCPGEGRRILERIFSWTNGHPYLTQKLCKSIAETHETSWSDEEVDNLVERLFLAEESRKEANLKFIQDRILSNEQFVQMLKLYKRVRQTKVKENGQSILQNQLMLSGLLTPRDGYLEVRNRIYRTVFNDHWINRNTPKNWQRIALLTMSSLVVILLVVIGYNSTVSLRLKTYQTDYIRGDPVQKMTALANIYGLRYWFSSNTDIDATAAQAFYEFTPDSKTQLSLFPPYGVHDPAKQNDLVTVIDKLYVTLANVEEENDNTSLLQAMDDTLHHSNMTDRSSSDLQKELDYWISGRAGYKKGDYVSALTGYTGAISINPTNQATLYERAKVYVALGQYEDALNDLDAAIAAAKQSAPDIPPSPTPTSSPLAPSETPSISITQTVNITPETSQPVPTAADKVPTLIITPTLNITPSPVPSSVPSPSNPIKPDKFESNFTTLNHVIVAIQALIAQTPELQDAIQSPANKYSNLDSVGLVKAYPPIRDGMLLLLVPAGDFTMGSGNGEADEQPVHTVYLDSFRIDQTEVTNAMYGKCVADGACQPPSSTASATRDSYYGDPNFDNYPVIFVRWVDAEAYCKWAGRRLPTEAEWEKAARGNDGRVYPWGDAEPNGNLLNYNNNIGDTTEVGQYPNGASPYGALDMSGNVSEWVADWYSETYYSISPLSNPLGPLTGQYRILRGGSFAHPPSIDISTTFRYFGPDHTNRLDGFRCAVSELSENKLTQSPNPSNAVLGGADKIAFVANNEIWAMNVDGSELKQLTADGGTKNDLQWLPDRETIVFISGLTVKYYNIKTDVVDTLTSFPSASSLNAFRVSHDGKQVIVAMNNEIFVVPFDINKLKEVHKKSDLLALQPCIVPQGKTKSALVVKEARWASDDKLVAWLYEGPNASDEVSVLNIADCNPETIKILDTFPGTRFDPPGFQGGLMLDFDWDGFNQFIFNTAKRNNGWGDLHIYNWESHKPNLSVNPIGKRCCYRDARWSPDGTYLLFAFQDEGLTAGAQTLLYYVPFGEIGIRANFTPIKLPDGFFKNPKEAPQPALRPAP